MTNALKLREQLGPDIEYVLASKTKITIGSSTDRCDAIAETLRVLDAKRGVVIVDTGAELREVPSTDLAIVRCLEALTGDSDQIALLERFAEYAPTVVCARSDAAAINQAPAVDLVFHLVGDTKIRMDLWASLVSSVMDGTRYANESAPKLV